MTHFLYNYRDDNRNGLELRYSLRGLEQNWAADEHEITIVGDIPEWLIGVNHVPGETTEDLTLKVGAIAGGVMLGAVDLLNHGVMDAVYMDDDLILTDPLTGVPITHCGSWSKFERDIMRVRDAGASWWREGARRTGRLLELRPDALSFEVHRPMPLHLPTAAAILATVIDRPAEEGVFWRSMYGNFAEQGKKALWARDTKVDSFWPSGSAWGSTDQRFWRHAQHKLERWLPTRSRWES